MLLKLWHFLYGCRHRKYTFPITIGANRRFAGTKHTYVVCLDCGKELPYDWTRMKIGEVPAGTKHGPVLVFRRPERSVRNSAVS